MIQLSRSMMERYEIVNRRPEKIGAVIFGADYLMLGSCARMLQAANIGAVCVSRDADALMAQDGMFTQLVRGETADGGKIDREEVVQSIVAAVDPEKNFDDFIRIADHEIRLLVCHGDCGDVETALAARLLYEMRNHMPLVLLASDHPDPMQKERFCEALRLIASQWGDGWIEGVDVRMLLCDCLSAPLSDSERALARQRMNYADDFICWAEPHCAFAVEGSVDCLGDVCGDFDRALLLKQRVFDTAVFLCAAGGYLCGMDSFAQTLKDDQLRAWIGRAFHDELLPLLPDGREEAIISAFERLENPMNSMPLMEIGRNLLGGFAQTLLPAIIAYADAHFDAPPGLSLAFAAAIMLYAGVRPGADGRFMVARENGSDVLHDDGEILDTFSRFAHDMPAESLAYAVLADRSLWGMDLREIDGLEMRVSYDLSAIQRIGLRETIRLKMG